MGPTRCSTIAHVMTLRSFRRWALEVHLVPACLTTVKRQAYNDIAVAVTALSSNEPSLFHDVVEHNVSCRHLSRRRPVRAVARGNAPHSARITSAAKSRNRSWPRCRRISGG